MSIPSVRPGRRARRYGVAFLAATVGACGTGGENSTAGQTGGCDSLPEGPSGIGTIAPLSGPAAALGRLVSDGADQAIISFSKRNDICGRPVENVRADDKNDPATALNLGRPFVSEASL